MQQVALKNIAHLYIRKKGKIKKSALKGASIGLLSGIMIALVDGPPTENCLLCLSQGGKLKVYGVTGFLNGAVLGAAIGSLRKKIPINPKHPRKKKPRLKNKEFIER